MNHVGAIGSHKLHCRGRRIQQSCTPAAQEHHQVSATKAQILPLFVPFISHDGMPGSGMRLRRRRDKTGLDEKLLLGPHGCRNLEADHFSPFIDVGPGRARPGSCEGRKKMNVAVEQRTEAHQNLDHEPSIALKLNLVRAP